MRVAGFSEGLESAIPVRLDQDFIVPVVSLPLLLVLKLFAWMDRKHEKRDAPDIYTLLKQYGDAGNEDRLFGEEMTLLESEGYDVELAGARLIGMDAVRVISPDTRKRFRNCFHPHHVNLYLLAMPRNPRRGPPQSTQAS